MFKRKLLSMVLLTGLLFGQSVPRAQAAICDQVQFVSDLTAPDGTTFAPDAAFTKTWRLKNIGTCTWSTTYALVWVGGDAIGAPGSVKLPVSVAPGKMLDISVKLTAPTASGNYKGLWKLSNAAGTQFGLGDSANDPFWVSISVVQTSAVIYDFVANAPYAQWKSGAGTLPFPVTGGDDRGYAYQVTNPHLEDDSLDAAPGLMTVPQNKLNGYIQATYPEFQVQKGDQIQTLVNCEFAATSCYVTFRIDYRLSNGTQGTLWTWKEAYDKKFYRKSINLDTLAGKNVQFVFMVLASGSASGDRAIWGSPRIIRAGTTLPPAFPATLTPLPPPAATLTPFASPPPTVAPAGCDKATFVSDVTVPDGTLFSPGTTFVKTWRLKNSGSCTWTNAYKLVFYDGEQMGAPTAINVPRNITPGVTVDLTVNMTAPSSPSAAGTYRGYWILSNATGKLFGIGTDASKPIWVEVKVSGLSPSVSGYDFIANACSAQWKSGAGILPCPGIDGNIKGYAINLNSTQLEDGTMGPAPSLLMAPEFKYNGYIQGTYPLFTVLPGDRFRGSTGCAFGASCYVTFRLDYMTSTGAIKTFWTWRESNDKKNNSFDLNLAPLAGQNVRFILTILATGSATNDRASWVAPSIVRLDTSGQVPPTVAPTNTPFTMPGTIVPSPVIRSLNMVDAFNGWAVGSSYLLRTNDGGVTWYNVTMPGVASIGNAYFQNANKAWVMAILAEGNLGVILRTMDGGHSWTVYDILPFSGGYIQFINDANGFVLSGQPSGMFKHAVDLYQTTDGGATWVRKYTNNPLDPSAGTSLPFGGNKSSMTFRDTLRGWVGGESPLVGSAYFYRTNDGGTTWSLQTLTLPAGYALAPIIPGAPKFFNANDAVLPVWMSLDVGRDLYIYVTHDGGTTWTRSTSFARQGWNADFVSVNDGFSWNAGGYLQVTHNAGASWTQVASNVNFGDNIPSLDFVSTTTGWLLHNHVTDDVTGTVSTSLYRTIDGGKTWTLLSPNQQPTATPTSNPTIPQDFPTFGQTLVNELNARNFASVKAMMDQAFGFAFWQSQGFSNTPDEAIQQLQNYLGATPLTPNASQDLNALLGGLNPYAIMGLDPATSQGLFVTGWGLDGKGEAILYATRRPNGSLYWNSVLIAPSGFIPDAEPITHEAFCADTRIATLLEQLKGSMIQSNGDMFSALVSPLHGVDVRLWAYQSAVNFNSTNAKNVFTSTDSYNWGAGMISGMPDFGTFKDIIQPRMLDTFNAPNIETYCDNLTKVFPLSHPWQYPDMRYYNLYKPASPDIVLDFRTWLIGFEYINGQPYISAMVTIVWEP